MTTRNMKKSTYDHSHTIGIALDAESIGNADYDSLQS